MSPSGSSDSSALKSTWSGDAPAAGVACATAGGGRLPYTIRSKRPVWPLPSREEEVGKIALGRELEVDAAEARRREVGHVRHLPADDVEGAQPAADVVAEEPEVPVLRRVARGGVLRPRDDRPTTVGCADRCAPAGSATADSRRRAPCTRGARCSPACASRPRSRASRSSRPAVRRSSSSSGLPADVAEYRPRAARAQLEAERVAEAHRVELRADVAEVVVLADRTDGRPGPSPGGRHG